MSMGVWCARLLHMRYGHGHMQCWQFTIGSTEGDSLNFDGF